MTPNGDDWPIIGTAISLGAGVQSTTLVVLALEGRIHADLAVFADTCAEPPGVYSHLWRLAERCAAQDFPLIIVSTGSLEVALREGRSRIPYYGIGANGQRYLGDRWCTYDYKIKPIHNYVRRRFGLGSGRSRIRMLLGISVDEIGRAKASRVRSITHEFPLLDLGWTRADCMAYLAEHGITAPKSSCFFCPFHTTAAWRELPVDLQQRAVELEAVLRARNPTASLHRSGRPLTEVLANDQLHLFPGDPEQAECEGVCFV